MNNEVFLRDDRRCVICGASYFLEEVPHHCFKKSEYFGKDRDLPWNRVTICKNCHFDIHHKSDKEKERLCKNIALSRYDGKNKDELLKIMREKRFPV